MSLESSHPRGRIPSRQRHPPILTARPPAGSGNSLLREAFRTTSQRPRLELSAPTRTARKITMDTRVDPILKR